MKKLCNFYICLLPFAFCANIFATLSDDISSFASALSSIKISQKPVEEEEMPALVDAPQREKPKKPKPTRHQVDKQKFRIFFEEWKKIDIGQTSVQTIIMKNEAERLLKAYTKDFTDIDRNKAKNLFIGSPTKEGYSTTPDNILRWNYTAEHRRWFELLTEMLAMVNPELEGAKNNFIARLKSL